MHIHLPTRRLLGAVTLLVLALGVSLPAAAQPPGGARPASPVGYTEVRDYQVRRSVQLPGNVEAPTHSLVASEIAGLVEEFLVREGDTVRKGQPLAKLRTTNLELRRDSALAQLKEAQARLKLAERNRDRASELFEAKVISRQQYDDAFYEFNAWQGRADSLTADIARINDDIERCTIRAPFGGTVTAERTQVGEWLAVGAPVVQLLALEELEIRVEVPEQYFRNLNPGAQAAVTFESLPGYTAVGKITAIVPRADPTARTFPLKVRINNKEGRVGVGMLAQVNFPAGESYRATVVPKDAVIRRGPQEFVYLMDGNNTVRLVEVKTGAGVGSWVEVRGELRAGEKVVTRGNERLFPGQAVQGEHADYQLP